MTRVTAAYDRRDGQCEPEALDRAAGSENRRR